MEEKQILQNKYKQANRKDCTEVRFPNKKIIGIISIDEYFILFSSLSIIYPYSNIVFDSIKLISRNKTPIFVSINHPPLEMM